MGYGFGSVFERDACQHATETLKIAEQTIDKLRVALVQERAAHEETRAERDRWAKRVKEVEAQLQRVREVVR